MDTRALNGRKSVRYITRPFEVRVFIMIINPIAELDDDVWTNRINSVHKGRQKR